MGIEQGVKRAARLALPVFIAGAGFFGCGRDGNSNVKAAVTPTTEVPLATATQEILSSPTAEATPTIQPREQATFTATPDTKPKLPEITHEQVMAGIQSVIDQIQNPDPALIAKYKITPDVLKREQDIIIRGFTPRKAGEENLPPTPDSLKGVENAIGSKAYTLAMERIELVYPRIRNSSFGDSIPERMSVDQARQLDPDKRFLFYPPDGSNPLYGGSAVKKDAASGAMKLYYDLRRSLVK